MNLNEISKKSDKKLFEELDKNNNTGFLTEDLVKIKRADEAGKWSKPMTLEEMEQYDRDILGENY